MKSRSSREVAISTLSSLFYLFFGLAFFLPINFVLAWNPQVLNGRCKQTGQYCYSTIGNAGGRGACCDPSNRNVIKCNQDNPCVGGKPYRWKDADLPLRWWFNPNSMPGQAGYANLSEAQIEKAFKDAWDSWTKPNCTSFRHKYLGKTSTFPSRSDQKLVLFLASKVQWAQMGVGAGTLAFTVPVPNYSGEMRDADIVFNPQPGGRPWKIYPNVGNWDVDLLAVAAHEIGHALGFAHTPYQNSLMYYASKPGPFQGLSKDEIDAVCYTYKKKGPCNNDSECGGCFQCRNAKCVPKTFTKSPKLCKPCKTSADCNGETCLYTEEGNRCLQKCDSNGCCPSGYRCSEIGFLKLCVPDAGKCPPVSCTTDNDCGPGEKCQGGVCKPPVVSRAPQTCRQCQSDSECGNGICYRFPDGKRRCVQTCVGGNFCPDKFSCIPYGAKRICFPPDGFCPCTTSSQCISGEVCRKGVCRPSKCEYLCPCSEDSHCSPGYKCFQTRTGGVCLKPCGDNAQFPPGEPGGPCGAGGRCTNGARCYSMGGGRTICLTPCSNNPSICRVYGGQCYRLGSQAFCLCRSKSECKRGQGCNKSILGQFGGGACASGGSQSECPSGFSCQAISQQMQVCMPAPTQGPGEPCNRQKACKKGLICVLVRQGSNDGICMEDCTQTKKCIFGGTCSIQAGQGTMLCGCKKNSDCRRGQTCSSIVAGYLSVCKNGGGNTGNSCGNGVCERDKGEDCGTCSADCKCTGGKVCRNNRCVAPSSSCGNGVCERDKGEDCGTCSADCKCTGGKVCKNSRCVMPPDSCGNGVCERDKGEDCGTCSADCKCTGGRVCKNNRCVVDSNGGSEGSKNSSTQVSGDGGVCPEGEEGTCGVDGEKGCGCSSSGGSTLYLLFFLLFAAILIRRRGSAGRLL